MVSTILCEFRLLQDSFSAPGCFHLGVEASSPQNLQQRHHPTIYEDVSPEGTAKKYIV